MAGFTIGVNALRTATQLVDLAGDNIANANTPGYHVKRADVEPVIGPQTGRSLIGLGSSVEDITRVRNELIERALLTHTQLKATLDEEVANLEHLETLFSEPTDAGLDVRLGEFFDSLTQLAANPDDPTLKEAVVQKAYAVADTFNHLDEGFDNVLEDLRTAAANVVEQINALTERIATLNAQIKLVETGGVSAPDLEDMRDELVRQLAELVNVTVYQADYGVVNVSCAGTLLVSEGQSSPLRIAEEDGKTYVAVVGSVGQRLPVREGRLAGMLEMLNNEVPAYRAGLDELANAFRHAINLVHTTALPSAGRFHSLEGANALLTDDPLGSLGYGVIEGTDERLVINVEDESTGDVTQYELTLDTTQGGATFLTSLRDAINAGVPHVTATIDDGKLDLQAEDGYAFGFATQYDPDPAQPGDISAVAPTSPAILDAYTGATDLVYEVTFLSGGEVGTDAINIQIAVHEPGGPVLRTITRQIDDTYDPGETIQLENGLKLTLSAGNVAAGDSFAFTAHASMDTAGVLDLLGLNTLFDGLGAGEIAVSGRIYQDPSNLAGGLRPMSGDNHRFLDMAAVRSSTLLASGTATFADFYRAEVSAIATARNTRTVAQQNQGQLLQDLENRRDSVSGVSVDEEMVKIMEAQTLYKGAAKYISAVNQLFSYLVDLV